MLRPLVKAPGRKLRAPGTARPAKRIPRQALIDRRDQCLAEILQFRSQPDDAGSLFEKARQLLTRPGARHRGEPARVSCAPLSGSSGSARRARISASIGPLDARVVQSLCASKQATINLEAHDGRIGDTFQ